MVYWPYLFEPRFSKYTKPKLRTLLALPVSIPAEEKELS